MSGCVLFALVAWTTIHHSVAQTGVCYQYASAYVLNTYDVYVQIKHTETYSCYRDWWWTTCERDSYSSEVRNMYRADLIYFYQYACCIGYSLVAGTCADNNECSSNGGLGPCTQICTNTIGSFSCSCNTGYALSGYACNDVDECVLDVSECNQNCNNTIGGYLCSCYPSGYAMSSDNRTCVDINECSSNGGLGPCAQICTNTVGSFTCSCNPGYELSEYACNDVDECDLGAYDCNQNCTNTNGSYLCSCYTGYDMSFDNKTCVVVTVSSDDGCGNNGKGPCAQNCTLTETPNHVRCYCHFGFILLEDGKSCLGQPHPVSWSQTATSIAAVWDEVEIVGSNNSLSYSFTCSKSSFFTISLNTVINQEGNITELEPFTSYNCCILAYTSIDRWSQACNTIQTLESVPSTAPSNVVITQGSASSVTISWNPPPIPSGMIRGYNIYINASSRVLKAATSSLSFVLRNLNYSQLISVQVSSYSSVGEGPKSRAVNGRTGCHAGMFYKISNGLCSRECSCGESQVKNYKDPITGLAYDAVCIAVNGDNIGFGSIRSLVSISPNTTIGTKVATVTVIQPASSIQVPFMRLSSHADTSNNVYPVVFGITPNATDPSHVTPVASGAWNSYQWIDITKYKLPSRCSTMQQGMLVQYSRYNFDIFVTSTVYPEGDWILSLNFQPPYDTSTAQMIVIGTTCPPSEHFDVDSKRCVAICGCGLIATKQARICTTSDSTYIADTTNWLRLKNTIATTNLPSYYATDLNGFWLWFRDYFVNANNFVSHSLFSFAHHSINFSVPFDNPTTSKIASAIYLLDNHIFLWGVGNLGLKYRDLSTPVSQLLSLKFDIKHLYSNYSTPVKIGTKKPKLVLNFQSGTKISSGGIIDLRGLTINCSRSDGVPFQSVGFTISVEFEEVITSLSAHVFNITANAESITGVYNEYTESFFDTMTISISVGPGTNGSLPKGRSCSTEERNLIIIDFTQEGMMMDVKKLERLPDSVSNPAEGIPIGFPFGNRIHTRVYVSSNGLISFDNPYGSRFPQLFPLQNNSYVVAPFWTHNNIQTHGSVSYVAFLNSKYPYLFKRVNSLISTRTTNQEAVQMQWMMIVQWNNIPNSFYDKENSYQAIITTDGSSSYAIFTYDCNKMGWSGEGENYYAAVGFDANGELFQNHPASRYDVVAQAVACENMPCSNPINHIVYSLNASSATLTEKIKDSIECRKIMIENDNLLYKTTAQISSVFRSLEPCPCSLAQAYWDYTKFRLHSKKSAYCFTQQVPFRGSVQQCCYNNTFGTKACNRNFPLLTVGDRNAGSMFLYDPYLYPNEHQRYDLDFKKYCCGAAGLCDEYRKRRPSSNCAHYLPPASSWLWGDPHITTLDGRTYTFNGWGEYILLQYSSQDNKTNFSLQGRMVPWKMTTATQLSALTFGNQNNDSLIEIAVDSNDKFSVFVDRENISSLLQDVYSTYSDKNVVIYQTENNSITCALPMIGFGITVSYTEGAINFVLQVPASWRSYTTGLLGNFNGNKRDDFIPRGSQAAISDSESDRFIHFHFAQTWHTSQLESMFSYFGNTSWQFYSHPTHFPAYADEIVPTDAQKSTCGEDIQCIYDLSQTNSTKFALEMAKFRDEKTQNAIIIDNFPPVISGSNVFVVKVNYTSVYMFTVTDDDNLTVGVVNGVPLGASLIGHRGNYSFTWTLNKIESISLTFYAFDTLNASSLLSVQVQQCACQNSGNCTLNGAAINDHNSLVMNCDCAQAYDGQFCENDRNGCAEFSCYPGVQCYDVPAPGVGIRCGPCPDGFIGDGLNCIDTDECKGDSLPCDQTYTSTPQSYSGSCYSGYIMRNYGRCSEIDEGFVENTCQPITLNSSGDGVVLNENEHNSKDGITGGVCYQWLPTIASVDPPVFHLSCSNTSSSTEGLWTINGSSVNEDTCSLVCGSFTLHPKSITSSLTVLGGPVSIYDIYYVANGGLSTGRDSTTSTCYILTNDSIGAPYNISVPATCMGVFMPLFGAFSNMLM